MRRVLQEREVLMTFDTKIIPYKVAEKTWVVAPTNLAMEVGGIANSFDVIEGPADLAIRLNSTDNDLIEDISGLGGVIFDEIYITSAVAADTCKIFVAYLAWEVQ